MRHAAKWVTGILLAGAIPVPIYPPTRPGQIEDHLRRQAGILQNLSLIHISEPTRPY